MRWVFLWDAPVETVAGVKGYRFRITFQALGQGL